VRITVLLGNVRVSTSSSRSGARRAVNRLVPCPTTTGWITSRYSSTRFSRISASMNLAPPWARTTPPGSRRSRSTSAASSPSAIRLSGQSARVSVFEKTTLGTPFMRSA
jgi:hypothetical protein